MNLRTTALSAVMGAALGLAATGSRAQPSGSETAAAPYTAPRTSWGHPDLQGVWDYRTITPLERRAEFVYC